MNKLDTRILDREMYDLGEAARMLGLPATTLRRWLLGEVRKGVVYLPVLREENNSDTTVRWGEFIEAGVLKTLRGDHRVALQELRVFCHTLRNRERVPYPLAVRDILLNGNKLLYPLRLAGIDALVDRDGQILTGPAIELFVARVRWEGDKPIAYRVAPDEFPDVEIDPRRRFGDPQIDGVSTSAVFELHQAGESVDLIAETWKVKKDIIREAIAFERAQRGEAQAA